MSETQYGIGVLFAEHPEKNGVVPCRIDTLALHAMQALVGGHIEIVPTAISAAGTDCRSIALVVDEEGRLKQLPTNVAAYDISLAPGLIVGNALLVGVREDELVALPISWLRRRMRNWELVPVGADG